MSYMNRFWKVFRLGLLTIVFIALALYLFTTTNWAKVFGRQPTYAEWIKQGEPIVAAVYRFKADHGLWPEYLDDLVPTYLSPAQFQEAEKEEWYYQVVIRDGRPGLSRRIKEMHRTHVAFDFDPERPSWIVFGDEDQRTLRTMTPEIASRGAIGAAGSTMPHEKVVEAELAELDRRIARSSGAIVMEYYRQKVSLLVMEHREEEARKVLAEAQRSNPNHFWPRLGVVKLDLAKEAATQPESAPASAPATRPALPKSFDDFAAWVEANPTFTHFYYLSLAYRWADRDADALAAMTAASNLPAETSPGDFEITAFYLWDMGRFALRHGEWDLVLKLTDAWSKLPFDYRRLENSYLALSAAAKLAKGDVAGAQADLQSLRDNKLVTWAQNLDPLEAAIKRGDRSFRYDPGNEKPAWKVFAAPQ